MQGYRNIAIYPQVSKPGCAKTFFPFLLYVLAFTKIVLYVLPMTKAADETKTLIINVPAHQHRTLRLLAFEKDTSMTELVRGAIERLLAEQEKTKAEAKSA